MSQRGSASRPVSPSSSKSPTTATQVTTATQATQAQAIQTGPASLHLGTQGGGEPHVDYGSRESGGIPRTNGDRPHPLAQRSLGVHNILNPTETSSSSSSLSIATAPMAQQRTGEGENTTPSPSSGPYGSNPPTPQPFMFQPPPLQPQQQPPPSGTPGMAYGQAVQRPLSGGRASPILGHPPHQPAGIARRFLTPRSPRASSMGHGQPPLRTLNPQPQYPPGSTTSSGPKRPYPGESGTEQHTSHLGHVQPPAPQLGRPSPSGASPSVGRLSLDTPTRSLSQQLLGHYGHGPSHQEHLSQQTGPRRPDLPPGPHFPAISRPTSRGLPPTFTPGALHQRPMGFEVGLHHGQRGVRGIPVMEGGHHVLTITPDQGDEIYVPVDTELASKRADEKRQRNAGASARFRARKKEREQGLMDTIERLQGQNRELDTRIRELEMERERYRAECDRLRDIVARTPGISDLARQSPQTTRSLAERSSPRSTVPPPPPLPAVAYGVADPETGERASRRRRTDPQLPYTTISIPPPTFPAPISQPGTPSSRTSRLPPLRLDLPESTASDQQSTTQSQLYSPYQRTPPPYESGWAPRPSGLPPDPGQR